MPARDGFQLTDHDIELVNHVFQLRLATVDHLSALTGRSVRALWARLLKLKERRYLASVARFMQKHVYAIGSEGIPLLIEHGYAPQALADKRLRHHELKEIHIRHSLFVADIHACMLILTRRGPAALAHWQEGSVLWDSVVPGRDASAIPVRPDAHFILQHADTLGRENKFHIFLEADRSTMSHDRMATKISGYVAYYEQRRHILKYSGMRSFLVATVTKTKERADELRKDLHPLIPRAARASYLFIPFEDLTPATLLPKAATALTA
jgi:hypothetical protein